MGSAGSDQHGYPPAAPVAIKILIAGGFGAGKTTLVSSVTEIRPLRTEEDLTAAVTLVEHAIHLISGRAGPLTPSPACRPEAQLPGPAADIRSPCPPGTGYKPEHERCLPHPRDQRRRVPRLLRGARARLQLQSSDRRRAAA